MSADPQKRSGRTLGILTANPAHFTHEQSEASGFGRGPNELMRLAGSLGLRLRGWSSAGGAHTGSQKAARVQSVSMVGLLLMHRPCLPRT